MLSFFDAGKNQKEKNILHRIADNFSFYNFNYGGQGRLSWTSGGFYFLLAFLSKKNNKSKNNYRISSGVYYIGHILIEHFPSDSGKGQHS